MAKRLTKMKAMFCEHWIATGNATASARKSGYAHPERQGLRFLEKDDAGEYKDKAIGRELARLRTEAGRPAPAVVAAEPVEGLEDAREELLQNLRDIALNEAETGSTRVNATTAMAKMLGVDRPKGQDNRDAEAARSLLRTLLGVKDV